ncbi:CRAL-TRIO lipid binding domain [Sergentomyia squamirostris]
MSYDKYECKLSSEFVVKAKENLREDENLRSQALDQFREWIEKNPTIKRCRMDANFLMRFLRTKKFSIPDALQLLENYLRTRKTLFYVFDNLDSDNPELDQLITNGIITILPEPDIHGSPVVLFQADNFDPKKNTIPQCMKLANLVFEILSRDERSQICGITQIFDCTHISLELLGLLRINYLQEFAQCWQKTFPFRHRVIYFVNMPSFAITLYHLFKTFLSEKLRSRLKVVDEWDIVKEDIGLILPKEFGGKIPNVEIFDHFKKLTLVHREEILALNDFDIDTSINRENFGNTHDAELDGAIVGSFRKIDVD